jgi:hypothetical protein
MANQETIKIAKEMMDILWPKGWSPLDLASTIKSLVALDKAINQDLPADLMKNHLDYIGVKDYV